MSDDLRDLSRRLGALPIPLQTGVLTLALRRACDDAFSDGPAAARRYLSEALNEQEGR